ncbi:MAG: hypothetical protein ISR89_08690 [Candidatus Marinimicrobia bacterium]|nr:hypothetical protein [Candidatus Neomarinimicrobiota bacterium]MBL7031229.1 hypothetical protein [Candidatus Neomarinimicrobiota bacterium]
MRKNTLFPALAIWLFLIFGCGDLFGPDYVSGGEHFTYTVNSSSTPRETGLWLHIPYTFNGFLLKSENNNFDFLDLGNNDTVSFIISEIKKAIPLIKGETYKISRQIMHGWPSSYGLIIQKNGDLIFEGITDVELGNRISIIDSTNISVALNKTLKKQNKTDMCGVKHTNITLKFMDGNDSVVLGQNESAQFKDWNLYVGLARKLDYSDNGCLDNGMNRISFTLVKR